MTRSRVPTVHCDHEDGCDAWDLDSYAMTVSTIDSIPVTATHRALGWESADDVDLCPEHRP